MPKIVDHAQRRRDIVTATWRVIARGGLANATTREIAKEAGYSNGVLAHYFTDRADILASALVMAHRGVRDRTDIRIQGLRGLSALRLLMIESLPLDEQGLLEAKIEACFWGEAVGNKAMMKIQNEEVDGFCARVRALLVQATEDGELEDGVDIDRIVHECLILMDGLSIQAVMYPARADAIEQVALLDALIDRIRAKRRRRPHSQSA
jgi:AcrR family transcriptional regulator